VGIVVLCRHLEAEKTRRPRAAAGLRAAQLTHSALRHAPPKAQSLVALASTTLAECVCATVFQGFVFGNTGTAEMAVEG
jgi:negative regulator of sigma E activity